MAEYIGIHTQIARNNRKSLLYLLGFILLVYIPVFLFLFLVKDKSAYYDYSYADYSSQVYSNADFWKNTLYDFLSVVPIVTLVIGIWFLIAFWGHSAMIKAATHAHSVSRKENPRIYNLTENLCMSAGMPMPKLQIIDTPAQNAFASGLTQNTYAVTLTQGIIDNLSDDELEGVIAHELMHIRNRDVRLLVISIVFVGIFSIIANVLWRTFLHGGRRRSNSKDNKGQAAIILIALALAVFSYLMSLIFKFGLSRKREYMADAGAADMTKKPEALARALRKISNNHDLAFVNEEYKQLFFANNVSSKGTFSLTGLFKTHPPIEKRIQLLENF